MFRRPTKSTRADTLFTYTTLCRSDRTRHRNGTTDLDRTLPDGSVSRLLHVDPRQPALRASQERETGALPPGRNDAWEPGAFDPIGRAHVCTPVTNAHLVCRLLLEKKKHYTILRRDSNKRQRL